MSKLRDAMPGDPLVTVIVPHFNDLEGLDRCLTALERQSIGPEAIRIVVADNCSPQGPAAVSQLVNGRAALVFVKERGAAPARNEGAKLATTPYLAFTDSDCVPAPTWLAEALELLEAPNRPDFVGGAMQVTVANPDAVSGAEAFELLFAFDNQRYVERKFFTVTANLICPKTLFDHVGEFQNGVSEDLEWCLRARSAGYRIGYAAKAIVAHPARKTWTDLREKWRRLQKESASLAFGDTLATIRWIARSWLIPLSIGPDAIRVLWSRRLRSVDDRGRALLALVALRSWRFFNAQEVVFKYLRDQIRDITGRLEF